MAKAGFWKADWLIGLVLAIVMLAVAGTDLIQSLERKAYDMGVRLTERVPSDQVAVIAIDDHSIANLGRWPWPRDLHAKMTDLLAAAKAKVIGNTVFFYEPEVSPGYNYISKLLEMVHQPLPEGATASPDIEKMAALLKEAENTLNTDRKLSESYGKANSVLLPMTFKLGQAQGRPDKALPEFVTRNRLTQVQRSEGGMALEASGVQFPIDLLGDKVSGLGHLNASGCLWWYPRRTFAVAVLRCLLPLDGADDRGQKPESGPRRHPGALGRGGAPGQAAHPDRRSRFYEHLFLQGHGKQAGFSGGFIL